jgi:secreted trypsin-like serine protease
MVIARRISAALLCALAACAFATSASAAGGPTANIIGGTPVSSDSDYPFLAAVLYSPNPVTGFYCGGTLIASRWVMTAGHCYVPSEGATPQFIGIGTADRSDPAMQVIAVGNHFRHPDFDPALIKNDVMLLHLNSAPLGITPIARATAAQDPAAGATVKDVGWGITVSHAGPTDEPALQANEATTEIVSNSNCAAAWNKVASISDSQICSYHNTPTFHSTCNGDSGGPQIYQNRQVGITSFGVGGCGSELPSVDTRVSSFNAWIDGTIQKNLVAPDVAVPFGTVDTDSGSVSKTVTVTSDGEQPITVTGTSTTGDYFLQGSSCSGPLAPGASCSFTVAFDPALGGTRPGTLKISTDSAGTATYSVPLTGSGFGRSSRPVKLHFKHSSAKRVGRKVKETFKITYKVPDGVTPSYACTGRLSAKMRVAGRSYSAKPKVYGVPGILGVAPQCYAKFTLKMASSAYRRKGKLKLSLPANQVLVASKRTVTLRIK